CPLQQPCERLWLCKQLRDWPAARLIQPYGQQVLRADVRIHHAALLIEQDDTRGERIEQLGGIEVCQRRGRQTLNGHRRPPADGGDDSAGARNGRSATRSAARSMLGGWRLRREQ